MKKLLLVIPMFLAVLVLADRYNCYPFFDGTGPYLGSGVVAWESRTNFYGVLLGGDGTNAISNIHLTYPSNIWTRKVGPILSRGTNVVVSFGFKGTYNTNAITIAGAGTSNGEYTYSTDHGMDSYTNGAASGIYYEDTTPSWRLTNSSGTLLFTNTTTPNGGTWYKSSSATVPTNSYFSGTSYGDTVTLVLARSWDGSNNWTHLTGVSCNMTNVAWTQSDTVVALSAQQLAYPYLMVYAGTNFNTNNAAITNAYLRVYSRSE